MGFSGGGSNVLKPHKHSSAVQDGSPLNMVNVTEGSLNSGDTVYSDGNALQRLAVGAPGTTMTVSGGNLPSWAAAASGAWTELVSIVAGDAADLTVGSIGGTLFSGYEIIRVIGTFSQVVTGQYFNLQFYNGTAQIAGTNYASQGIFGSRAVAILFYTESSLPSVPLGFCGASTPVYFDMTFSVQGNGNPTYPNRNGEQKSAMNGGNGEQIAMNSSCFAINSASDLCGFTPVAGGSGGAVAPVAGSVYMKVFGT